MFATALEVLGAVCVIVGMVLLAGWIGGLLVGGFAMIVAAQVLGARE